MNVSQGILAAIVGVIMIMAVMPLIQGGTNSSDQWEYDDYKPAIEVSSTTGAVELVTLDNVPYIHAKDVGTGSITYANGEVEHITVHKAKLDVVLALGQSNNTYLNADLSEVVDYPEYGMAYYFGTPTTPANGKSYGGATFQSFYDEGGALKVGDKLPHLCYEYTKATGHKVYYIIGASGSTSITDWIPNATAWNNAKTVVNLALNQIDYSHYVINTTTCTWIQGESSRYVSQEEYIEDFLALQDSLHDGDFGLTPKHTFIALPMKYANPILAQQRLGEEYRDITVVTDISSTFTLENGLLGPDNLHYSQLGYNLIGTALGESCGSWVESKDATASYDSILFVLPVVLILGVILMLAKFVVCRRT